MHKYSIARSWEIYRNASCSSISSLSGHAARSGAEGGALAWKLSVPHLWHGDLDPEVSGERQRKKEEEMKRTTGTDSLKGVE